MTLRWRRNNNNGLCWSWTMRIANCFARKGPTRQTRPSNQTAGIRHLLISCACCSCPRSDVSLKTFAYAQASVDLARMAIALERYRLAHGEYPESLDALAPQFMEKVPHDVIGGRPLHYRRTDDGQFVLYSVGWNETDDGGVVVLTKGGKRGHQPRRLGLAVSAEIDFRNIQHSTSKQAKHPPSELRCWKLNVER